MPLTPSLLIWIALAGAPIVIHLLNRRRYRTIKWGAMQFLEVSVAQSSRRLRIEQLLILLIRMLIIALIVYAMARPYLPGALPGLASRPKRNVVVILDNSQSMRFDENRASLFVRAKEAVSKLCNELEKGDSLNVILADSKPQPLVPEPIVDLQRITALLKNVESGGGEANLPLAFEAALTQLEAPPHNPLRQIYIITDRQSFGWHAKAEGQWYAALTRLNLTENRPKVFVLAIGDQHKENLAVTALEPARGRIGIYQPTRFDVRITNFGKMKREDLNVTFSVAGASEQNEIITVAGGESVSVPFYHKFSDPGSHLVHVRIDSDALPADDQMTAAVDVADAIPVLLVDGSPDRTALSLPSPLEIALCPRDDAMPALRTLLDPQVARADEIPQLSIDTYQLVILHNVKALSHRQVSDIEQFVDSGGGLLILPGDQTDQAFYNRLLYRNNDGPLPAMLERADDHGEPLHGVAQAFAHPALNEFRDPKNGDFTLIEVYKHYRLVPDPKATTTRVIAKLDNGDPLFVEKRFGQGRAIAAAVPIDASWTNLQKRPYFVPLVHYICYYLAGAVQPPRNVPLGSAISCFLPKDSQANYLEVLDPEGRSHQIQAIEKGQRLIANYGNTQKPGVYKIIRQQAGEQINYVVRPPTEESNLADLTTAEQVWLEKTLKAHFAKDWADLQSTAFAQTKHLREFWQLIVCCVLGLVLMETWLTGRFAKKA